MRLARDANINNQPVLENPAILTPPEIADKALYLPSKCELGSIKIDRFLARHYRIGRLSRENSLAQSPH
jgi:hypothetical protein